MDKSDWLAQALGAIDELNSWVGLCRSELSNHNDQISRNKQFPRSKLQISNLENEIKRIQANLLTIGSGLAGSGKRLSNLEIKRLEKLIDKLTDELPDLKNFIYPVGGLQIARAVCRRAEREVVTLKDSKFKIQNSILKYLNRLSDALFVMGRWVNHEMGIKEETWKS